MGAILMLGLLAYPLQAAHAAPSEQVPIGPRAIAMGGAYSSLAQDASAMFWNPAGLSWIGHQELAGTYANLYQSGITDRYAAFVLPISRRTAFGMDWYHSGFNDSELNFGENRISLSSAMQVNRMLSAGLTAKYLTRDTDLADVDGATVARGTGVGMDAGALLNPLRGLRVGVVAQDLFNTSIHYSAGNSTLAYPRNVRVGASYSYADRALLAFDVDDRWHVGAEVRPVELLALRAGVEKDRTGSDGTTFTTGLGVRSGIFRLDYAYVIAPSLPATSHFGFSMAFNFNPAQIRIEKVETDDIFASLYKTYARVPFGHAVVRNLGNKALDTRVSVQIPGLMDLPSESFVTLSAGAATPIDLFANLSDRAMAIPENRRAQVRVSASYKSDRLDRTDRATGSVTLYAPGAIDWNRGVEQTAAFITTDDPVVDSVATRATLVVPTLSQNPFPSRSVANAAAIFDAMEVLGVVYVPDPNDPYPTISQRAGAVDHVNYPRQTIEKRAGDCDDTTVLLAALFGHVGIATKIVAVPGHLFLLFDTGYYERDRHSLGVEDGLFVVADEGLWVPLETTALQQGFAHAWQLGAAKYSEAEANHTLDLVDVPRAQSSYESSLPPGSPKIPAIESGAVLGRLAADANLIAGWKAEYMAAHFGGEPGAVEVSDDARDELAHIQYLAGRIADALHLLADETRDRPGSARGHNNLGNVHAASGDYPGAVEDYRRALEIDPNDPGIWLNSGLALDVVGDTAAAFDHLTKGIIQSGGYAPACNLLGLPADSFGGKEGPAQMTSAETRRLLRSVLLKLPMLDSLRVGRRTSQPSPASLKAIRLRSAVTRGEDAEASDLRNHLYWRERE